MEKIRWFELLWEASEGYAFEVCGVVVSRNKHVGEEGNA